MLFSENTAIAVLGFGRTGRALLDYLLSQGCTHITVRDRNPRLAEDCRRYGERGVRFVLGEEYLDDIGETVLFRSPGIRPDHPALAAAVARGAILTSETELFFSRCPATIIGVTGSDGKTTTTTLIYKMLREAGVRAFCGGNIGVSPLTFLAEVRQGDVVVLELSSFQLMTLRCSPHRAVCTNLSPNHLDYHTDFTEYAAAKQNICLHAPCTRLVYSAENATTRALAAHLPADVTSVGFGSGGEITEKNGHILVHGKPVLATADILLPGKHNLENYMAAIGAVWDLVSPDAIRTVARTFRGVAHRLQTVCVRDGVTYLNSSIDTTPTRTAAALSALTAHAGRVILLLGGYDKRLPYDNLMPHLDAVCKQVILTGANAPRILETMTRAAVRVPYLHVPAFDDAVRTAMRAAVAGDVVLLSPAAAGFDAFTDFAARGDRFVALVTPSPRKDVP